MSTPATDKLVHELGEVLAECGQANIISVLIGGELYNIAFEQSASELDEYEGIITHAEKHGIKSLKIQFLLDELPAIVRELKQVRIRNKQIMLSGEHELQVLFNLAMAEVEH